MREARRAGKPAQARESGRREWTEAFAEERSPVGHASGAAMVKRPGQRSGAMYAEDGLPERAIAARAAEFPTVEEVEAELRRVRYRRRFGRILLATIEKLIVVAAISVLVATIWLPVLRIYGSSMTPTLNEGDIVVTFKGSHFDTGDVVGLYVGNRLLVKRVIAGPGQWVDITEDGTVYVDGKVLNEPYLTEKALGDCNIELPYQVPESRYFVLGDHRSTSVDSRHTTVGSIADEEIVGRIMFRIWPLGDLGRVE